MSFFMNKYLLLCVGGCLGLSLIIFEIFPILAGQTKVL